MIRAEPWPFVRSEFYRGEVDSTNDWCKRLIIEGSLAKAPALVWAARQTRGRGQGANSWWSDGGSLTASVVVDPEALGLAMAIRPLVALGVASVVVAAVEELVPECRAGIRWPNDIEVDGRKLGGVLVEGVVGPTGPRLVIGVGVNVSTRLDLAPAEVRSMAATLAEAASPPDPRRAILRAILGRLEALFQGLTNGDPSLVATWNRLDTLLGQTITVQAGNDRFLAVAEGIDPSGGLRIEREGRSQILFAGRILREEIPDSSRKQG